MWPLLQSLLFRWNTIPLPDPDSVPRCFWASPSLHGWFLTQLSSCSRLKPIAGHPLRETLQVWLAYLAKSLSARKFFLGLTVYWSVICSLFLHKCLAFSLGSLSVTLTFRFTETVLWEGTAVSQRLSFKNCKALNTWSVPGLSSPQLADRCHTRQV